MQTKIGEKLLAYLTPTQIFAHQTQIKSYKTMDNLMIQNADVKRGSVKTVVISATRFILRSSTIFMYSPFQGSVKVASTNTEYFMLP